MTNLLLLLLLLLRQRIKKQTHHFANKGPFSQRCGFFSSHIWMWELAEHQPIDAFELWCWKRLLRVPWTARRSNQSILKEINPEYSLEGLMPEWYFIVYMYHSFFIHSSVNDWIHLSMNGFIRQWWMSRLLPCPNYCEYSHNEHWDTCVFFSFAFHKVYA